MRQASAAMYCTVQLPIKIMEIQGQTLSYLNFWPIFEAECIILIIAALLFLKHYYIS
jgi:hypothetical protein